MARREAIILRRGRAALASAVVMLAVAWLPLVLPPLRAGRLGIATFDQLLGLSVALSGVVLPLFALLSGAELMSAEIEDGSLVPILSFPISRDACFAGKCLGRGVVLALTYVVAFGSAGVAVVVGCGANGLHDYAATAAAGLLLSLSCGGLGAALGSAGRGRVRAFGAALCAWVALVFALDAALLAGVVALAPPPPEQVGTHGHSELAAPGGTMAMPIHDPHAHHADPEPPAPSSLSAWLMALSPVDLYRLTSMLASSELRSRLDLALPGASASVARTTIVVGWIVWITAPVAWGTRRFRRAILR